MSSLATSPGGGNTASRPTSENAGETAANDPPAEATATGQPAKPGPWPPPDLPALIGTAIRDELDGILPHVVAALKRDRAFDELTARLDKAERRLEARRERPLAVAVHRLLNRLRHLEFDRAVKASLEAEVIKILADAGFAEIGRAGEEYDPERHDALGGRVTDGKGTVTEVEATGLGSFGDVIVRAQVLVGPRTSVRRHAAPATSQELATEPQSKE